jgi:hypothetical protein
MCPANQQEGRGLTLRNVVRVYSARRLCAATSRSTLRAAARRQLSSPLNWHAAAVPVRASASAAAFLSALAAQHHSEIPDHPAWVVSRPALLQAGQPQRQRLG